MNVSLKNCVITGSSAGIGKATAIEMAKLNYSVIMLVKDSEKSRRALEDIKLESNSDDIKIYYVNLSSQKSIRNVVKEIKREYSKIDVLINNAGVVKRKHEITDEGIEMTMAVNYFATFLLTNLLIGLIEKSPQGRIINLTSALYKNGRINLNKSSDVKFNGSDAYAESKKLVVYFTQILSRKIKKVTVNCLHPGVIATDSFREYPRIISKSINFFLPKPKSGAKPVVNLATSLELQGTTGRYYYKFDEKEIKDEENHKKLLEEIWNYSKRITNLEEVIDQIGGN